MNGRPGATDSPLSASKKFLCCTARSSVLDIVPNSLLVLILEVADSGERSGFRRVIGAGEKTTEGPDPEGEEGGGFHADGILILVDEQE